jgi:hypothetical protein
MRQSGGSSVINHNRHQPSLSTVVINQSSSTNRQSTNRQSTNRQFTNQQSSLVNQPISNLQSEIVNSRSLFRGHLQGRTSLESNEAVCTFNAIS